MATITVSKRYNPVTKLKNVYGGNITSEGVISIDDLIERIQNRCTITKPDIMTCLQAFQQQTIYALRNAQSVNLGNLGNLYIKAKTKKAETADLFKISNVVGLSVGFRPSKKLKVQVDIKNMAPVRVIKK